MSATSLLRHQRRGLALELVRRRLRTNAVNCLTGLPEAEIRLLYWMLHGERPPGGPLPSTGVLLASRGAQARVSAFVSLYRRIGGPGAFAHVDPVLLIKSYDLFQELAPAEADRARVFDFTAAWVVTRDLRSGVAEQKFCKVCRLIYLTSQESTLPPNCPFAASGRRRRSARRERPCEPGRRRPAAA